MGQTCPMINISPKHLAKPLSLLGSLTLGLKKMPCRPLCIKYSYLANSHTVTFNCWALSYNILGFCCHNCHHHHHWRYQTRSSHLHKQRSPPSPAQNILQARTASHPQVHTKSRHCPFSAYYAVMESRRGFRHRAISLASLTSTRTRFCLKNKKPVLK